MPFVHQLTLIPPHLVVFNLLLLGLKSEGSVICHLLKFHQAQRANHVLRYAAPRGLALFVAFRLIVLGHGRKVACHFQNSNE
jgi:hypothetical protein